MSSNNYPQLGVLASTQQQRKNFNIYTPDMSNKPSTPPSQFQSNRVRNDQNINTPQKPFNFATPIAMSTLDDNPNTMSSPKSQKEEDIIIDIDGEKMNAEKINDKLLRYRYKYIGTFRITNGNGSTETFIRAINPVGIIVLINMYMSPNTIVRSRDLSLRERVDKVSSVVDTSLVKGVYDSFYPHVSSAAITCQSGVCMISGSQTQPEQEPIIKNYDFDSNVTLASSHSDRWIYDDNRLSILPIINFSEIESNKDAVLTNTMIASFNIQNQTTVSSDQDVQVFKSSVNDICESSKMAIKNYSSVRNAILHKIKEHRDRAYHLYTTASKDSDLKMYERDVAMLVKYEESLVELNKVARTYFNLKNKIDGIVSDISILDATTRSSYISDKK